MSQVLSFFGAFWKDGRLSWMWCAYKAWFYSTAYACGAVNYSSWVYTYWSVCMCLLKYWGVGNCSPLSICTSRKAIFWMAWCWSSGDSETHPGLVCHAARWQLKTSSMYLTLNVRFWLRSRSPELASQIPSCGCWLYMMGDKGEPIAVPSIYILVHAYRRHHRIWMKYVDFMQAQFDESTQVWGWDGSLIWECLVTITPNSLFTVNLV